jgi:hypothetical protein
MDLYQLDGPALGPKYIAIGQLTFTLSHMGDMLSCIADYEQDKLSYHLWVASQNSFEMMMHPSGRD